MQWPPRDDRQTWLARKKKKYAAYKIETNDSGQPIRYRVVGPVAKAADLGFDPTKGTTRGGTATCPACGTPLTEKHILTEAQAGRLGAVPISVVFDTGSGKGYREVTERDRAVFQQAEQRLALLQESYDPFSGELTSIPDESLPPQGTLGFRVQRYGFQTWGDLFNARQALALAPFVKHVRNAYTAIQQRTNDTEYAKALATYLAIVTDRVANQCSVLSRWNNVGEKIEGVFARQALPMLWDYVELTPFSGATGDWLGAME
jgi:adenine-specific DNA methylase